MFSSSKKPSPSSDNSQKRGTPSIIAEGLVINGNVSSEGEVHIDGVVTGDVTVGMLAVGEFARLTGEVIADSVIIRGEVLGRIRAKSVELGKTAKVRGDIWHELLSIAAGAKVEGLCKYAENPREDAVRAAALEAPARKDNGKIESSASNRPDGSRDATKAEPTGVKTRASNELNLGAAAVGAT